MFLKFTHKQFHMHYYIQKKNKFNTLPYDTILIHDKNVNGALCYNKKGLHIIKIINFHKSILINTYFMNTYSNNNIHIHVNSLLHENMDESKIINIFNKNKTWNNYGYVMRYINNMEFIEYKEYYDWIDIIKQPHLSNIINIHKHNVDSFWKDI